MFANDKQPQMNPTSNGNAIGYESQSQTKAKTKIKSKSTSNSNSNSVIASDLLPVSATNSASVLSTATRASAFSLDERETLLRYNESADCCCSCHITTSLNSPGTSCKHQTPTNTPTATMRSQASCSTATYSIHSACSLCLESHSLAGDSAVLAALPAERSPFNVSVFTEDDTDYDSDSGPRYSYKGHPPELYSPKKDFIYKRPLVEKQLVLKKTCEWWFYKNKCSNMSTHLRKNVYLAIAFGVFLLFGICLYLSVPAGKSNTNWKKTNQFNQSLITSTFKTNVPIETTTTTTFHYENQLPDTRIIYENNSYSGVDNWEKRDEIVNDINDISNSIPEEFTSDFVRPEKIHSTRLNEADLLYESKRNNYVNIRQDNVSAFSLTGTYRSKSSQIWDPHPEYTLQAFGHNLHLVLHQDTSFISPKTFRVIRILNNRTEEEDSEIEHYLGCYYTGHVEGDEQSAVAVSLCNGMTGYIKTSFGSLLIQPVNQTTDTDSDILHKVWRHSKRNARHAVSGDLGLDLGIIENAVKTKLKRRKRNSVDRHLFTMEVLIAVDKTMTDFHANYKPYILTLLSIVSNIFADASIGNSIYISVANILFIDEYLTHRNGHRRTHNTAHQLLKKFCAIVSNSKYHYDTAMFITRDPICGNEQDKCDTLGLAEMGTVCSRQSCAIVQDNGLPAAFTIAHELGHVLNMPHDDHERCMQFNKPGMKKKLHIMSSIMADDIHPWSWSDCSRHYVSELLEKEDKTCLEDTPTHFVPNYNTRLPGEIYSLDQQCQLIHGNESRICLYDEECKKLFCKENDRTENCVSSNLPWADGTPCREDSHWCQKGECVPKSDTARNVVNGGWGRWSPFTPCSLTCGGGVQESQRECNNPLPKNGGKYCTGAKKKYRSCNTQACPAGSLDSREQQCYEMNGRNLGIKGIETSAKWIPKYGLPYKDKCKLYCRMEDNRAYFALSDKVKDGTTCSFDSFDKCVNGICRPAGCDNELNSSAKLDKCGVCEGRNDTCEEFTGNFFVSDLYRVQPHSKSYYYHVTVIPKGASNIVITQPGYYDENYIVLRDDQNNYLLNENHKIIGYRDVIFYADVAFEYNGSKSTVERVNTTYSRKLKRDLIVEIISFTSKAARNNDTLLVTYTYTKDKPDIEYYRWEMQPWSGCDSICQGMSHRTPVCLNVERGIKVAPQFCDQTSRPTIEYRSCNTDCNLTLNTTSISECSAQCGMWGVREKNLICVQNFPSLGRSNLVDMSRCEEKFEINRFEQCQVGCWNYTKWSSCSKTCGSGSQTRSIGCFLNQTRVSESLCDPRRKPNEPLTRSCNTDPCWYNEWKTGEWGQCNDLCKTNRTVTCLNPKGCLSTKPNSQRNCCKIKFVMDWAKCSVECGNGIKKRLIYCARVFKPRIKGAPNTREMIDDHYCRGLKKPNPKRTEKTCSMRCKWFTSNWTQCPADCSVDYQRRTVYCESDRKVIKPSLCNPKEKPIHERYCSNCIRRKSLTSKCSCSGLRKRKVICYTTAGAVPCPNKEKIIKEKCQPPPECSAKSCKDVKRFRQDRGDGEYQIYIRSKPKRIYCHNMSSVPKEYITLNPSENYSIYYSNKTRRPEECPPSSRSHEFRDNSLSSGTTTFRKIRIQIEDLRVIDNDYTFADWIGKQQPYGSAGDCYNRNGHCPQGDFSINLAGTGFFMRRRPIWSKYGDNVIMKLSDTFESDPIKKRAFCGGYCGRCALSPNFGLYLDVV